MSGTDNAPAIQAALDFGMRRHYPNYVFPNGRFLVGSSLHAGWGNAYHTLNIRGGVRESNSLEGTVLYFNQFNQPFMNFQAVRSSSLKGVVVIGRNYNYLGFAQGKPSFSSNRADWVAPEFSPPSAPGGLQTNAPFAGVTEDAYCGTTPAIPYPNKTYPAWTGLSDQYGLGYSSDVELEDVEIDGFGVAYANGLNCSAQADFTKIVNLIGSHNAYVVSVTNNQSRNVEMRNFYLDTFFTAITSTDFGSGTGELNGPMSNIGVGHGFQIFKIGTAYSGPVTVDNIYGENLVRIGDFRSHTIFPSAVIFHGGYLYLDDSLHGQIPSSYVINDGPVTFRGTTVIGNQRIALWSIGGGSVTFEDGGVWRCALASPTTTAQLLAINYSGGCLMGNARGVIRDPVAAAYYPSVGATQSANPQQSVLDSTLGGIPPRVPMTQGIKKYIDEAGRAWNMTVPPLTLINTGYSPQVGTAVAITNDVMTFGYCSAYQARQPVAPGMILESQSASALFVVTSVGSPTTNANCAGPATSVLVTAWQQNNLNITPGTNTFLSNNITAANVTGYLYTSQGPLVTLPTRLFYGTFTSGSASVTSVQDQAGNASNLANFLASGDQFYGVNMGGSAGGAFSTCGASTSAWPIPPAGLTLSAVTAGTPGSIALGANAQGTGIFPIFPFELRP
jgi:hypothetical protein